MTGCADKLVVLGAVLALSAPNLAEGADAPLVEAVKRQDVAGVERPRSTGRSIWTTWRSRSV
jgi:hypothetical protein